MSSIVDVRWHPLSFKFNSTTSFGVVGHRGLGGHQPAMLFGSCTRSGDNSKHFFELNSIALLNLLLHIFELNSATSASICLSNIPLNARRTSSTCWFVLCITTGFHAFFQTKFNKIKC